VARPSHLPAQRSLCLYRSDVIRNRGRNGLYLDLHHSRLRSSLNTSLRSSFPLEDTGTHASGRPSILHGVRARPLTTSAIPDVIVEGPVDSAHIDQLNAETDALLLQSSNSPSSTENLLHLMSQWAGLHELIKSHGLGQYTKRPTKLMRRQWSDGNDPTMQAVVKCAERVEDLLRHYNENGDNNGTDDDDFSLEPYRLCMSIWSQTPTTYSGDRAAAILDMWGSKYGGDMSHQPTIHEFDVVLETYALSATVYENEDDADSHDMYNVNDDEKNIGGSTDGGHTARPREYPEDKALSTLRLLRNLGDMYLVPTITTVSCVIQALRRASRTPRGQSDGRNEERTRIVTSLLREMEDEAALLFDDDGRNDDAANQHRYRYVQACCDAFTMAARSLPMQEAVREASHWLNEIDRRAFVGGTTLRPTLSTLTTSGSEQILVPHTIDASCNYTIRVWKDRSTADDTITGSASPIEKLHCVRLAAGAADDIIAKLQRWEAVKLNAKQCRRAATIFCQSTHPSIVITAGEIGAMRDMVPLVQRAEELALEARHLHHDNRVGIETFLQLIGAWAQLSGVVSSIPATERDGFSGSRPAERVENILKATFLEGPSDNQNPQQCIDADDAARAYNYAIMAWARSRTGRLGGEKALALFDSMRGTTEFSENNDFSFNVSAPPDERTYASVFKALRYAKSPREAIKAETLLNEMIDSYTRQDKGAVRPNARHFGTVIAALARSGHYEAADKAKKLLKTLLVWYHDSNDYEIMPNGSMFCDVIVAIGRRRNDRHKVLKVSNLLKNLRDLYDETGSDRLQPNVAVYGAALGALSSANGADAVQMVEDVIDEMKSKSIEPNKACYTSIITAFARNGYPEKAEAVLKNEVLASEDERVIANTHDFNVVINGWARDASPEGLKRSRALLDDMLDRYGNGNQHVKPDSRTFTALINALWKSDDANATLEAEEVLQLMEESYINGDASVAPSCHSYTSVINTFARSNVPDKAARALALLRRANEQYEAGNVDARPDISMYTGVLNACAYTKGMKEAKAEALRIALEIAEELTGSPSLQVDGVAYNTLFQVYGYLIGDAEKQARLSSALLKQCCKDGQLNSHILSTLKKFAPTVYFKLPGAHDGFVKLGALPEQWSRNTR